MIIKMEVTIIPVTSVIKTTQNDGVTQRYFMFQINYHS